MRGTVAIRHREGQERIARRLFLLSLVVFAAGAGVAAVLIALFRPEPRVGRAVFYPAFGVSTLLLFAGSVAMHLAASNVRHERQRAFRRCLVAAIAAGIGFIGVQSYGIWSLLQNQVPRDVPQDINSFVVVFAFMHAMHFAVALLFLLYVTLHAFADRYDHEYYWGVIVCEFFWHALGIVWLAIAAAFGIAIGATM